MLQLMPVANGTCQGERLFLWLRQPRMPSELHSTRHQHELAGLLFHCHRDLKVGTPMKRSMPVLIEDEARSHDFDSESREQQTTPCENASLWLWVPQPLQGAYTKLPSIKRSISYGIPVSRSWSSRTPNRLSVSNSPCAIPLPQNRPRQPRIKSRSC